jgi:hypothetical protein
MISDISGALLKLKGGGEPEERHALAQHRRWTLPDDMSGGRGDRRTQELQPRRIDADHRAPIEHQGAGPRGLAERRQQLLGGQI